MLSWWKALEGMRQDSLGKFGRPFFATSRRASARDEPSGMDEVDCDAVVSGISTSIEPLPGSHSVNEPTSSAGRALVPPSHRSLSLPGTRSNVLSIYTSNTLICVESRRPGRKNALSKYHFSSPTPLHSLVISCNSIPIHPTSEIAYLQNRPQSARETRKEKKQQRFISVHLSIPIQ